MNSKIKTILQNPIAVIKTGSTGIATFDEDQAAAITLTSSTHIGGRAGATLERLRANEDELLNPITAIRTGSADISTFIRDQAVAIALTSSTRIGGRVRHSSERRRTAKPENHHQHRKRWHLNLHRCMQVVPLYSPTVHH